MAEKVITMAEGFGSILIFVVVLVYLISWLVILINAWRCGGTFFRSTGHVLGAVLFAPIYLAAQGFAAVQEDKQRFCDFCSGAEMCK